MTCTSAPPSMTWNTLAGLRAGIVHIDLPIALGLLIVMGVLPADTVAGRIVLGELALDKLTHSKIDPQDPSRLINLGTAYARLGKTADAQTAYKAAITSDIRYDVELANGTYMDSRWAARTALANLDQGKPLLALAR